MDHKEISQKINNATLQTLQSAVDASYDVLAAHKPKGRIPEQVFTGHFLPFFSGNTNEASANSGNIIAEWIGVAGSATSEVDVIDGAGNVLYTVPALYNTDIIGIQQAQGKKPMSAILYEYEVQKTGVPMAAINNVNNELANKFSEINLDPASMQETTQRWNAIMDRYGIKPNEGTDKAPSAGTAAASDDVVYD